MARNTKIAAIFGHPSYLYGHLRYTQSLVFDPASRSFAGRYEVEALQWVPGHLRVRFDGGGDPFVERVGGSEGERSLSMVKNRWIYVFVYRGEPGSTRWFLEMFVDGDGRVHVNPATEAADRLDWIVGDTPPSDGPEHELPRTVTGRKWYFSLIGTPFRLGNECIAKLERDDRLLHLSSPVDLSDARHLEKINTTEHGHTVPSVPHLAIPVLLPFDVARQLSHDIVAARSKRANLMGLDGERRPATASERDDAEKYFFSRALQDVADHPDLGSEIENDFATGKLAEMRAFVADFERRVQKLDFLAESLGAELARWFERDLCQILLDGALPEEGAFVMEAVDEIFDGLTQSAAGLACLGRHCEPDRKATFVHRYFAGTSALGSAESKMVRFGLARFVNAFANVQKARVFRVATEAHQVLQSLDTTVGPLVAGWASGDLSVKVGILEPYALRKTLIPGDPAAKRLHTEVRAIHAEGSALSKLAKAAGKIEVAQKLFDTINFALAVSAYLNTDPGQTVRRRERLIGAAVTGGSNLAGILNKAFDVVGRKEVLLSARFAVRSLGFVTAAYSYYLTWGKADKEFGAGDYDAAIANHVSGVSALFAAGISFACTASGFGPLGWFVAAFAVAAGAAQVFYYLVKDEDLETLTKWSRWGEMAFELSTERAPPWSPVALAELSESWENQSVALGALQRQFAIGFGARASLGPERVSPFYQLRIYVGHVDPDTTFDVTWSWKGKRADGPGTEAQAWVPTSRAHGSTSGPTPRAFGHRLRVSSAGEPYFDVNIPEQAWNDSGFYEKHGGYGFEDLTVSVHKRYTVGKFTRFVPPVAPIEITIQPGDKTPNTSLMVPSLGDT